MEKEQSFNDAATTGHPHAKKKESRHRCLIP